jgi:hypothetical protein
MGVPNIAEPPPTAIGSPSGPPTSAPDTATPKLPAGLHEIVYRVTGTATSASITYITQSGTEENNGATVPWRRTMIGKDFRFLSVSAQNDGDGAIGCEIDIDGTSVKRAKSSGAYAIASCDAPLRKR